MPFPPVLPTQTVQPALARQPLVPTLAFPSVWWTQGPPPRDAVDAPTFPERHDQACRNDERSALGAVAFITALRTAHLVCVVDAEFRTADGADPLERALARSSVLSVKLLTGTCPGADDWCRRVQKALATTPKTAVPEVRWKTTLKASRVLGVHDRFAIIDDELWHFGATVGGSHRSVTAYSRGWSAQATRAGEFFEEAWNHE